MRVSLLLCIVLGMLLWGTAQATEVEKVEAEIVPDLGMAIYDLPAEAFQLTKFEKHVAEEMALNDPKIKSMLEHTAVLEFHHEGETEAEEGADMSADTENAESAETEQDESAQSEDAGEAEAEAEAEAEDEMETEAENEGEVEVELDAEQEAELENELTSDSPVAFLELDQAPANSTKPLPTLVLPKIIRGVVGLPPAPKKPKKTLKPCPDKKRHHRHGRHLQSRQGALVELDSEAQKEQARRVHIHVRTKLHGGEGSENLLRVEDRFDRLHDRVMGRLNRLMSRIKRHPESVEDKVATFHFTE